MSAGSVSRPRLWAAAGAALVTAGFIGAAPAGSAPGFFVYTPAGATEPVTVMNPAAGECIATPNGSAPQNYTLSDIQLFIGADCTDSAGFARLGQQSVADEFESVQALG